MSLTAEALKQLGSEAAEGVAQEKKDWDAVSASANEALHGIHILCAQGGIPPICRSGEV